MIILSILGYILLVYFICALIIFFSFIINRDQVKYTNYKTSEVKYLNGYKKLIAYFCMALIWIFVIKFNKGE